MPKTSTAPMLLSLGMGAAILSGSASTSAAPAYDGYVESTTFPIRVHYTEAAGEASAQEVLGYAEEGWQTQVVEMGFTAPTAVNDQNERVTGLWIYLDPAHGADHPEPIGDNPDTTWTDCTTRVRISTLSPSYYLRLVTLHEMHHVLEYSADCGEPPFTIEQSTVAVTTITDPDDTVFLQYMLPVFQQHPENSLHCTFYYDQDKFYFHYGSALFQLFLEDRYGSYDGTFISSIWEAAKQNGSVTSVTGSSPTIDVPNSPNIFDAIEATLGDVSLEEAYVEFARWRTFVGTRDDGAHFRHGAQWSGGEVAIDTALVLDSLPVVQGTTTAQPNELGSVYLSLDPFGIEEDHGVRLAFDGDEAVSWNVDALLIRSDHTADVETMTLDESGRGELMLGPLTDYVEVLVAFENLGDGTRDPENPQCWNSAGFVYDLSVEPLAEPPVVNGVQPSELLVGQSHYLWIDGSSFGDGAQVALSGGGVQVNEVDFVDENTLGVDITVLPEAALGSRDLTVTNPGGDSDTLTGAVTLTAGSTTDDSCGCILPGSSGSGWRLSWVLAALGAALVMARRRSAEQPHRRNPSVDQ